ncbi:MAG: ABC transporter ATP-binding protein [Metamycoplasmataceae bacterium]
MLKLIKKRTLLYMLGTVFFIFLQSFESITESFFIGEIMELIQLGERVPTQNNIFDLDKLTDTQLIITYSSLVIIGFISGVLGIFFTSKATSSYIAYMRLKAYEKIQSLSYQDIDKISTSSLITRITNDTEQVSISLLFGLRFFVSGIFVFIYGMIVSFISYTNLSWIFGVIIPFVLIAMFVAIALSIPQFTKSQKNTDSINKNMRESILGIRVVKAFNLKEDQKDKFHGSNEALASTATKAFKVLGVVMPLIQSGINISIILVLTIASFGTPYEFFSVAPFISILMNVLFGLITMIMVLIQVSRSIPSIIRIKEVLNWQNSITYKNDNEYSITDGEIKFENVSYKFYEDSAPALENINLTIKPGEHVGIIGRTGSGKSTFINLIARLFDPTEGNVLIDGINIKDLSFNELNKNVAMAMQTVTLFSGTIRSNIAMGIDSNIPEEEKNEMIEKSAKIGEAWEFISKKDDQLDSIVEQRGKNFSGGQKQRISIARTVAKKSKIIIFDDSTSALDNVTEAKVQKNIKNETDATTIIVAQRISSVENLDRIIVIEAGRIDGFDTHKNLLKSNDIYRDIAISQLGPEKVKEVMKGNKND